MKTIDLNYKPKFIYAINGSRYRESYEEFKHMDLSKRRQVDLLRGHHFFGSHEYLREGATYFTIVREPISRIASLYNYLREIDLYKDINQEDMGLAQFFDSGLAMAADNGMTRMLTNNDFSQIPNGQISEDLANEAIENMEKHFTAIGLLEHYDESMKLFKSKLEWKNLPDIKTVNKTNKKLVSTQEVSKFLAANEPYKKYIAADLAVYEYAKERFSKNK